MKLSSFEKLFHVLLSEIYYVEKFLVEELPVLARKAQSKDLKEAFHDHLKETKEQVARIEKIFHLIGTEPLNVGSTNPFIPAFEKSGKAIEENNTSAVTDAALIVAAQRVEHYEIATYGALIEYADAMSLHAVKDLLKESIKEEGHANNLLTKIAKGGIFKSGVNEKALHR